jgi:hypothetical protein
VPGTNSGIPNAIKTSEIPAAWAMATRPRYHFCGGAQGFFQRAPYRNVNQTVTRLIALCPVGSKDKWIHAVNVAAVPTNVSFSFLFGGGGMYVGFLNLKAVFVLTIFIANVITFLRVLSSGSNIAAVPLFYIDTSFCT